MINSNPKPAIDLNHIGNSIEGGIPASYENMQLIKTECGRFFLGICRGGTWLYKSDIDGKEALKPVPDEFKITKWIDLD